MKNQLLVVNCATQFIFLAAPIMQTLVCLAVIEAPGGPPGGLGLVKRYVRAPQQFVGLPGVGRRDGDTDAGTEEDLVLLVKNGFAYTGDDSGAKFVHVFRAAQ